MAKQFKSQFIHLLNANIKLTCILIFYLTMEEGMEQELSGRHFSLLLQHSNFSLHLLFFQKELQVYQEPSTLITLCHIPTELCSLNYLIIQCKEIEGYEHGTKFQSHHPLIIDFSKLLQPKFSSQTIYQRSQQYE